MTLPHLRSLRAQLTAATVATFALVAIVLAGVSVVVSRGAMLASIDADLQRRGEGFAREVAKRPDMGQQPNDRGGPPRGDGPGGPGGPDDFGWEDDYRFEDPGDRDRPSSPIEARNPGLSKQGDPNWVAPTSIPVGENGEPSAQSTVYDPEGYRVAAKGQVLFRTFTANGEERRVFSTPVRSRGRIIAVIQVAHQLSTVYAQLEAMRWTLLATVLPIGLLMGGVAAVGIVNRLMRPLRQLNDDAIRIGQNGFGERLKSRGQDEFASLSNTLNDMLASLESTYRLEREANERQRRFTADASHEIKTPLSVIKAHLGILKRSQRSVVDEQDAILTMDRATERMTRLLQSLLTLAKSDGGIRSERFPCRLDDILEDVIQTLPEAVGRVEMVCSSGATVMANPDDLYRLFGNLIENALKHSATTEPVEVHLARTLQTVNISIQDHGVGISPEHLPHLFERFYRVDRSRASSSGGAGLGLSICEQIVESHGGQIHVASEVGVGTVFTVTLPTSS